MELGHIVLREGEANKDVTSSGAVTYGFGTAAQQLNTGDTITAEGVTFKWAFTTISGAPIRRVTVYSNSGITGSSASCTQGSVPTATIKIPAVSFAKGTAGSYSNTTIIKVTRADNSTHYEQFDVTVQYITEARIRFSKTATLDHPDFTTNKILMTYDDITGESTKSQLGNPSYIDCDLGDAYKIESGEYISMNQNVDLGSDLPKLAPGSNTVTFDNTVTELKITPRWWKV